MESLDVLIIFPWLQKSSAETRAKHYAWRQITNDVYQDSDDLKRP